MQGGGSCVEPDMSTQTLLVGGRNRKRFHVRPAARAVAGMGPRTKVRLS